MRGSNDDPQSYLKIQTVVNFLNTGPRSTERISNAFSRTKGRQIEGWTAQVQQCCLTVVNYCFTYSRYLDKSGNEMSGPNGTEVMVVYHLGCSRSHRTLNNDHCASPGSRSGLMTGGHYRYARLRPADERLF